MSTIFKPKDLPIDEKTGVKITTLANQAMLGSNALQVKRITMNANSKSDSFGVENAGNFVYIVRGKGQAQVGNESFPMDAESVLWLEKSDAFHFESGANGLEVLLCNAPAGKN